MLTQTDYRSLILTQTWIFQHMSWKSILQLSSYDYANKSTVAASYISAKNHKWKLLFNETTVYINHQQMSNTQLRYKSLQYIWLLVLNEIHTYNVHVIFFIRKRLNPWVVERNYKDHTEMARVCETPHTKYIPKIKRPT
jgi:hypothetical protein